MNPESQDLPFLRWRKLLRMVWRVLLVIILLALTSVSILFVRSDIGSFRPRLPKIMKLVEEQRAATPQLPPFLRQCLTHEAGNDAHIARRLLAEHGLNRCRGIRWMVRWTFWRWSLKWHLSVEERQLLYCRFISDLEDHLGIQHVAQKLYQKPLEGLDDRHLASLVVAARSSARYLRDHGRLNEATEQFLAEMR